MKIDRKKLIFIVIILSVILMISYGISYAKYASNSMWNYFLESKGFYFRSKTLSDKTLNNNWDGGKVYFDIRNSLNDYVATEYDIEYKITCNIKNEVDAECKVNGNESNTYKGKLTSFYGCINTKDATDVSSYDKQTCNNEGYTYKTKETIVENYFEIVSEDENVLNNITVEIIKESISPYVKTIQNDFILSKSLEQTGSINKIYNEYDEYSRLIITNSFKEDKCINLSFDSDIFRIDNDENITNYTNDENGYINSLTFKIKQNSNINFLFYRQNLEKYSVDNFEIIESKECQ